MKKDKINIDKLINQYRVKYSKYNKYLDDKFYADLYKWLDNQESLSISDSMIVENIVIKKLSEFVKDGDIDLEILIMEEYFPRVRFAFKKIGISDILGEDAIIQAIETYEGQKMFSSYIIECARNPKINNKKLETENGKDKEIEVNKYNFINQLDLYVKNNNIKKSNPTYLESIFSNFVFFKEKDFDSSFYKFIYLKYGYHNGIYFSLDDISKICNENLDKISEYYKQSLITLKQCVNDSITKIIQYIK